MNEESSNEFVSYMRYNKNDIDLISKYANSFEAFSTLYSHVIKPFNVVPQLENMSTAELNEHQAKIEAELIAEIEAL